MLVLLLMTLTGQPQPAALAQGDTSLLFIENVGQFSDGGQTRFLLNLGQMTIRLAEDGLWLTVVESPPVESLAEAEATPAAETRSGVNLKLTFIAANPQPDLQPFNPVSTNISYFSGVDPANWYPAVPVWGGVRYVNLYSGIDLVLTGQGGQLAAQLVVQDETQPLPEIRWQIEGADALTLIDGGRLRLTTAIGDVTLPLLQIVTPTGAMLEPPVSQPVIEEDSISAPFTSLSMIADEVMTMAGATDLVYSTLLGGSSSNDEGRGLAVDDMGNAYVAGNSPSPDFPTTPGAFDTSNGLAFVAKLNPDGTDLVYATFLGGARAFALAVDQAGQAFVTGDTASSDFPATSGAFDTSLDSNDAFVAKLNSTGTDLIYATYLGGSDAELGYGLAVDEAGNAYVTGFTSSTDFPATAGAFQPDYQGGGYFGWDAFVAKLDPTGAALDYATFLAGSANDQGNAIAVDGLGNAYVTGQTDSPDFPTTPGAFNTNPNDSFVVKLNPAGSELEYATFLGGNGNDDSRAIAVDRSGQAFVAGDTTSNNFPTTPGAFQPDYHPGIKVTYEGDVFVTKLNTAGSDLVYSTYLGGSDHDNGFALGIDQAGRAYVTGSTYSTDFPSTPDAFQPSRAGYPDAFVAKLNSEGSGLDYGTFLGGNHGESGYALAADADDNAYVTGYTSSTDFPVTAGAFDTILDGSSDGFVAKLATGSGSEPPPTPTPVPEHNCTPTRLGDITVGDNPRGIAVDSSRNRVYVANYGSNSVAVIDSATNALLQTIDGVDSANGLAYDPSHNMIWVTNYELDSLTPIQANDAATSFTVLPAIGVGDGPWGVAYDPVHNNVYVANSLDNSITVVDAAAQTEAATLTESFNEPYHLAANPVSGKVYVANHGHNSVTVVEGTTVSRVVPLWDSGRAYGIAVDETRNTVYVATIETNRIVAIGPLNGQTDQFLGWASFQRGYNPNRRVPLRAIAVNPDIGPTFDGGHLWATTVVADGSEANQLLLIPKGWSSRFHVPFTQNIGSEATEGIAIDRTTDRVYVSNGTSAGMVTVVGDHTTICGGVAPAAIPDDTDQISYKLFSLVSVTRSDVNSDGVIDIRDLAWVAARFGSHDPTADLNEDGVVDMLDLSTVARNYGQRLLGVNP